MSDWQKASGIFCGVSNNEKNKKKMKKIKIKKDLFFVVRNGYRALLTIALMPIKQYTILDVSSLYVFLFCPVYIHFIFICMRMTDISILNKIFYPS